MVLWCFGALYYTHIVAPGTLHCYGVIHYKLRMSSRLTPTGRPVLLVLTNGVSNWSKLKKKLKIELKLVVYISLLCLFTAHQPRYAPSPTVVPHLRGLRGGSGCCIRIFLVGEMVLVRLCPVGAAPRRRVQWCECFGTCLTSGYLRWEPPRQGAPKSRARVLGAPELHSRAADLVWHGCGGWRYSVV